MSSSIWTLLRVARERNRQERSCSFSPEQLSAHQTRTLAQLRQFVLARSPFYQRFHRGLEGRPLEALPILSKSILMEHFDELVTDRTLRLADLEAFLSQPPGAHLFRGRYVVLSTSGSTGRRGVFVFDSDEWIRAIAQISRPISWQRAGERGRPARSALIASGTWWHYSARVGMSLSSRLLPTLRIDAAAPLAAMVRQLNEWQPQALAAYPSVLRLLAEEQLSGRLRLTLRHIATSAEVITARIRERVREAWGVTVRDTYGATEYAPIASECQQGNKHLFEDGAIIEVVDEAGRAVADGTAGARVLLTVLARYAQPLIRYELSDLLRLKPGRCACGRPFRMVEEIEGRIEEILEFPLRASHSGRVSVHPNVFHELLERVPAAGWQVIQQPAALRIHFVGVQDGHPLDGLAVAVRGALAARGAELPEVTVAQVAALERGATGKAPLIMAMRPPAGAHS